MDGSSHPERAVQLRAATEPTRPIVSILASAVLLLSSCSTIVGTVKPVDEKSERYEVMDLSRENPKTWRKLDQSQLTPKDADIGPNTDAFSSEYTDVAYQSASNAAIISLNSSCRRGREQVQDLHPVLRELLLGMTDVEERTETATQVSGTPALGGTIEGKMAGEHTKIQAVVVSKDACIYDLMYIARPERFKFHEGDFNRFISSFKLR